jgi:hypothetical protein
MSHHGVVYVISPLTDHPTPDDKGAWLRASRWLTFARDPARSGIGYTYTNDWREALAVARMAARHSGCPIEIEERRLGGRMVEDLTYWRVGAGGALY